MLISKTPYRVSLFGGCTDYENWYEKNGGCVLGGAINHYCYIMVKPYNKAFNNNYRVAYRNIELVDNVDDIEHPAIKACLEYLGITDRLEIVYSGDLPSRSGLGSSSSFVVGLLNALHWYKRQYFIMTQQLVKEAIEIERHILKEPGGIQDQIFAANSGLNFIDINTDGSYKRERYFGVEELESKLHLYYTGIQRNSCDIVKQYSNSLCDNTYVTDIQEIALEAKEAIWNNKIDRVGYLLDKTWAAKKKVSSEITLPEIDEKYTMIKKVGALGGKLLGGGCGGSFLVFTSPKYLDIIDSVLSPWVRIPFKFSDIRSEVVYNE
jgi:D-glycero-alpha-D-manno-heptose-7-phosphate kinase